MDSGKKYEITPENVHEHCLRYAIGRGCIPNLYGTEVIVGEMVLDYVERCSRGQKSSWRLYRAFTRGCRTLLGRYGQRKEIESSFTSSNLSRIIDEKWNEGFDLVEFEDDLAVFVGTLEDERDQKIVLYKRQGLNLVEIAERLQTTPTAISNRLQKIREEWFSWTHREK